MHKVYVGKAGVRKNERINLDIFCLLIDKSLFLLYFLGDLLNFIF